VTARRHRYFGRREILVGVFVLAVLLRLIPLLARGGLGFWNGYDDGVYYAAADALTFGHMPYRDYLLLHPPGIVVLLAPFAALGRVTTDATGMIVARCAFIAVGALNASLVAAIAYRWSRRTAVVAGVLFACWYPAVVTEQTPRLEPVGTTLLLVALLLLVRRTKLVRPRHELLAGAALGLGAGVKIWGMAPWAALVLWELIRQRWAAAGRVVAGGVAALAVLLLPFFIAAPSRMADMVIRDQFRRAVVRSGLTQRLSSIFGIDKGMATHHSEVAIVVAVIVLAAAVVAMREGLAQPIVVVLVVSFVVLLASPSYFRHYAEFVAAPAVLVIAIAAGRLTSMVTLHRRTAGVAIGVVTALVIGGAAASFAIPEKVQRIAPAVTAAAPAGCLKSDDPGVLIQMNRLSQGFRDNCHLGVDVWGKQQDALSHMAWQQYLVDYLRSGDAFVLARPNLDNLTPQTIVLLNSYPPLAEGGGLVLRRGSR